MFCIGMLMPRSSLFPALGMDLLNGIKQRLKEENIFNDVKLVIDNIGFGTDEQEIYGKAEKMLLQEDADAVVVYADEKIAEMLQPLFTATNRLFLVINTGANFPDVWQPAATSLTHSLHFAFLAGLTGKLAAKESGKETANVISYYDGGYRQCYSMLSNHQNNGGIASFNHITHLKLEEFTLEPLQQFLEEHTDTRTLLCLFCGEQADAFFKNAEPLYEQFDLTVYGTPMMFEPLMNNSYEDAEVKNIRGFIPWSSSLMNEQNILFKQKYTGGAGNYFSVLGWEAGMIVAEACRFIKENNNSGAAIVNHLKTVTFETPRGMISVDPATHYTLAPGYFAEVKDNNITVTGTDENFIKNEWDLHTRHTLRSGESSSWRNTYLCI